MNLVNSEGDRKIGENQRSYLLLNGTPRKECLLHEKINFAVLFALIAFFVTTIFFYIK